ncbi:MAG: OadG family protein [Bacillota bacterium]
MDWEKAFTVAITGIISVFLALGILNLAVSFSGYLFKLAAKREAEKSRAGT